MARESNRKRVSFRGAAATLALMTAAAGVSGCNSSSLKDSSNNQPGTTTPGAPPPSNATFTQINQQIIQPRCLSCHASSVADGGVDLSSYSGVFSYVQPGSADSSRLYQVVASGEMPRGGPKLSDAELQQLAAWINNGALND